MALALLFAEAQAAKPRRARRHKKEQKDPTWPGDGTTVDGCEIRFAPPYRNSGRIRNVMGFNQGFILWCEKQISQPSTVGTLHFHSSDTTLGDPFLREFGANIKTAAAAAVVAASSDSDDAGSSLQRIWQSKRKAVQEHGLEEQMVNPDISTLRIGSQSLRCHTGDKSLDH